MSACRHPSSAIALPNYRKPQPSSLKLGHGMACLSTGAAPLCPAHTGRAWCEQVLHLHQNGSPCVSIVWPPAPATTAAVPQLQPDQNRGTIFHLSAPTPHLRHTRTPAPEALRPRWLPRVRALTALALPLPKPAGPPQPQRRRPRVQHPPHGPQVQPHPLVQRRAPPQHTPLPGARANRRRRQRRREAGPHTRAAPSYATSRARHVVWGGWHGWGYSEALHAHVRVHHLQLPQPAMRILVGFLHLHAHLTKKQGRLLLFGS